MNGCQVVYQWMNRPQGDVNHLVVLTDSTWRGIPAPMGLFSGGFSNVSGVLGTCIMRMDYREKLYYSSDAGTTWDSLPAPKPLVAPAASFHIVRRDRMALLSEDGIAVEFGGDMLRPTERTLPTGTRTYRMVGPSLIVANAVQGFTKSVFMTSADSGRTWLQLDSIKAGPGGTILRGDNLGLLAFWMEEDHRKRILCVLQNGMIVRYKPDDNSWDYLGRVSTGSLQAGNFDVVRDHSNTLWFRVFGNLYTLPADGQRIELVSTSIPSLAGFAVLGNTITSVGEYGAYFSDDDGKTWYLSAFHDSIYTSMGRGDAGLPQAPVERFVDRNDTLYLSSAGHGSAFVRSGTKIQYLRASGRTIELRCSNGADVRRGRPISTFTPENDYVSDGDFVSIRPRYRGLSTPLENYSYWWFGPVGDSSVVAAGDTMLVSNDDGTTWRIAGAGLPKAGNGKATAASDVLQTPSGTWLLGLRGWSTETDDTTLIQPGGLYLSSDEGRTWAASSMDNPDAAYIWDIHQTERGMFLATAAKVTSRTLEPSFEVGDTWILSSSDDGKSWTTTQNIASRQRPAIGFGYRIASDDHDRIAVLSEQSVWLSTDNARTWTEYPVSADPTLCLVDLAFHGRDSIVVGTTSGLVWIPIPATSIETDPIHYTSVWAYPTPVTGHNATIRFNNVDLQGRTLSRVSLVDVNGATIRDLTGSLLLDAQQQRQEFVIATSDIPNGLYFIVLDAGTYRTVSKLLIARSR
jgi:hypothetical protein